MDLCADSTILSANIWNPQHWEQRFDIHHLMDLDVQPLLPQVFMVCEA